MKDLSNRSAAGKETYLVELLQEYEENVVYKTILNSRPFYINFLIKLFLLLKRVIYFTRGNKKGDEHALRRKKNAAIDLYLLV